MTEPIATRQPGTFARIGTEVGQLVEEKNAAYGDSFAKAGSFLALLYPGGIVPSQYGDALALVRIFDKQMRIARRKGAFGESPYRDIAGYGILGAAKDATREAEPVPPCGNLDEVDQLRAALKTAEALVERLTAERNEARRFAEAAAVNSGPARAI